MNYRISLLLVLGIFTSCIVSAQPTIIPGGNVSGNWYKANSPYNITGNITIPGGYTLIIEPGVEVSFAGKYSFTVQGLLQAIGTATDTIYFTASTEWSGLSFNNAQDSSHLEYCKIERSTYTGIICANSNPSLTHCTITNNGSILYGGIYLYNNSNPHISYCSINNNTF